MKTHTITLSTKQDILFYIGESAGDNMIVIEKEIKMIIGFMQKILVHVM